MHIVINCDLVNLMLMIVMSGEFCSNNLCEVLCVLVTWLICVTGVDVSDMQGVPDAVAVTHACG
jgi:hypothetical protein